jgi:hypothetical protein
MFVKIYRGAVFALCAALAGPPIAGTVPTLAQSSNLVANPIYGRELPLPGWLANHRDEWVRQHAEFQATCGTGDVVKEIRFLNKLIAYDEYLLSMPNAVGSDNSAAPPVLRRDIGIADALIAHLQQLPPCDADKPVAASATSSMPAPPAISNAVPEPAPLPTEAKAAPEPTPATAPPAAPAAPPPSDTDRLVIRFDDKVAALTPSGARAFNKAVAAANSGKPVRLAIEGCGASADFSSGSPCARWLYSLENRLGDAGVKNPRRLFADLP